MKKLLALVALVIAGALLAAGCSSGTTAVSTVSPSSFLQVAAQPGVTVVDVRTPEEYAAGHLSGAVNINVEGPDFDQQISTLDRDGAYAVYCHSGRRSALAADAMAKAGFTKVTNLQGGLADLQAAGGQIATS